ncbi:MAG: class I SAM-dependent methyltransferase [Chthoniobacterales bacterium]|nr:class I SAM-dependent methyltransferase [Chthoniobacterales bacterium]
MFIELFLNPAGRFLDYAAGYGLFVRLMRDIGYDFHWADKYCQNLFARGFEEPLPLTDRFAAVTAFEVFEHLPDPMGEFAEILKATDCLILSTSLLPAPAPPLEHWPYYGLEHGQHISFYTLESLKSVGQQFGFQCISDGEAFHVLMRRPITPRLLKRIDNVWWQRWISRTRQRASLTGSDNTEIVRRLSVLGAGDGATLKAGKNSSRV